ncbi:hypothetical protein V6N13_029981 [Hibiscus sabdariffa]
MDLWHSDFSGLRTTTGAGRDVAPTEGEITGGNRGGRGSSRKSIGGGTPTCGDSWLLSDEDFRGYGVINVRDNGGASSLAR